MILFISIALLSCLSTSQSQKILDFDINITGKSKFVEEINLHEITRLNINVSNTVGFFIVQVHTYNETIVLSETSPVVSSKSIKGTNVGLVKVRAIDINSFYIFSHKNVSALVVVVSYNNDDPIPGGCNLTFKTEIAPYLNVTQADAYVKTEYQMASIKGHLCEENLVEADIYTYYLPSQDFTQSTYFNGIKNMLTVDNIRLYGTKVPRPKFLPKTRQFFNRYYSTVSVYAIVAKYGNKTAAYVPAVSFMCDSIENYSCNDEIDLAWKIIIPIALLVGLGIVLDGEYLSFMTHFITASLVGFILILIFLGKISYIGGLCFGAIFGFIIGLFWTSFSLKFDAVLLPAYSTHALCGFIIAQIFLNNWFSDNIVSTDTEYWLIFFCIVFIVTLILSPITCIPNRASTAIVGACFFVCSLSYYLGTYVHYIFITTIRRATIPNFGKVILNQPVTILDVLLYITWILIILLRLKLSVRTGYTAL